MIIRSSVIRKVALARDAPQVDIDFVRIRKHVFAALFKLRTTATINAGRLQCCHGIGGARKVVFRNFMKTQFGRSSTTPDR
jgi:hypothetical protein